MILVEVRGLLYDVARSLDDYEDLRSEVAASERFLRAARVFCISVCAADERLHPREASSIDTVFWDAPEGECEQTDTILRLHPESLDEAIEFVEQAISAEGKATAQLGQAYDASASKVVAAIALTCQMVLAADDEPDQREIEALSEISLRLRQRAVLVESELPPPSGAPVGCHGRRH